MLSAMLTMADQLGLDTLAEGVETAGEHAVVAELGCGFVQGFGIARPMPIEQTSGWIRHHAGAVGTPPRIGRATG
jgi:EAL domain-containing protein (putative c-di-GMP-specific phosphodiesterase class I)